MTFSFGQIKYLLDQKLTTFLGFKQCSHEQLNSVCLKCVQSFSEDDEDLELINSQTSDFQTSDFQASDSRTLGPLTFGPLTLEHQTIVPPTLGPETFYR